MSEFTVTSNVDGSRSFQDQYNNYNMKQYGQRGSNNRKSQGYNKNYKKKGGYNQNRDSGANPRSRLGDDDDVMGDDPSPGPSHGGVTKRYSPYGSRGGYRGGRGNYSKGNTRGRGGSGGGGGSYDQRGRPHMDHQNEAALRRLGVPVGAKGARSQPRIPSYSGQTGWYKITIPHGQKQSKDFMLKSMLNLMSCPLVPVNYHFERGAAIFHVTDGTAADEIRSLSRRITTPDNFKVIFIVTVSSQPNTTFNEETMEKVKVCLSRRYDPASKSLDMSKLVSDPELLKDGIHLSMVRSTVVNGLLKIIEENISDLEILNLSGNRLQILSLFESLSKKAPNIARLDLGNNLLKSESELKALRNLNLQELCLEGNPLCDKFDNAQDYVSAIRKRFPKVVRLDRNNLPPVITFEVEATTKLPPSLGPTFGASEEVKTLVCRFLEQFFQIYDSGNRQPLLEAYHEQAIFSLNICENSAVAGWQAKISPYFPDSRNLIRLKDPPRRSRSLKVGKLGVVAHLNGLPKTQHDPAAFVVDVNHSSPSFLSFTVRGIFKEVDADPTRPYLRSFSRIFVTVPQGNGIVIANEALSITNLTADQKKKAFQTPAPAPAPTPAPSHVTGSLTPEQQAILAQRFSTDSGMNLEWSAKCLEQNAWDYELSAKVFTDLQAKGSIPPEAFNK